MPAPSTSSGSVKHRIKETAASCLYGFIYFELNLLILGFVVLIDQFLFVDY